MEASSERIDQDGSKMPKGMKDEVLGIGRTNKE